MTLSPQTGHLDGFLTTSIILVCIIAVNVLLFNFLCAHPFAFLLYRALMTATVELDAVAGKDAEDAGAALESAGGPDVLDGIAGVIHLDHCLLPVNLQSGFQGDGLKVFAALHGPAGAASLSDNVCRQTPNRREDIADGGGREELALGVYAVVDADKTYIISVTQVE